MDTEIQSNYSLEGNYDGKQNVTPFFVPNQFGLSFVFCVEHKSVFLNLGKTKIFLHHRYSQRWNGHDYFPECTSGAVLHKPPAPLSPGMYL